MAFLHTGIGDYLLRFDWSHSHPRFSAMSKCISPLERRLAERRLEEDNGADGEELHFEQANSLILAMKDWKVWWSSATMFFMVISTSYVAFFPSICETMGFKQNITLLLCAPPWIFAGISNFVITGYVYYFMALADCLVPIQHQHLDTRTGRMIVSSTSHSCSVSVLSEP